MKWTLAWDNIFFSSEKLAIGSIASVYQTCLKPALLFVPVKAVYKR